MIIKFFFFICLFLFPLNVSAQDIRTILTQSSYDELMELMSNPSKNEEALVKLVFSFDEKYHQYIMPMIARTYGISEKVRMMPGIVEWRRKLPVRIAPRLNEFAKEHLRYLNPAFYPFLMPEAWPENIHLSEEEGPKENYLPRVYQTTSAQDMEHLFPSSLGENSLAGKILSKKHHFL